MAKRTRQLFQEAKRAQVMDELTRSGTTPPDMIEQIAGQEDLLGLDGDEMSAAASEATTEHPEDECDIKPQEAEAARRRAAGGAANFEVSCPCAPPPAARLLRDRQQRECSRHARLSDGTRCATSGRSRRILPTPCGRSGKRRRTLSRRRRKPCLPKPRSSACRRMPRRPRLPRLPPVPRSVWSCFLLRRPGSGRVLDRKPLVRAPRRSRKVEAA